jgi:hypothetical protein
MMTDLEIRAARKRAQAALDAAQLVRDLPRDLGDRAPLRLAEMKRPLWARLTSKRPNPFRLRYTQVSSWMNAIANTHPPLVVEVERVDGQALQQTEARTSAVA